MRIPKVLAVAATGCALVAAVAVPASAHAGHAARPAVASKSKVFKTTLSPKSGIKTGTKLTLKGTGAQKNARFSCVLIVIKGTKYALDGGSLSGATSTKKGVVTCHATFKPFSGTVGGKKVSCPTTKANKKAGYKCAFAVSNSAQTDSGISYFTAKK
jgi:hypothetical protein